MVSKRRVKKREKPDESDAPAVVGALPQLSKAAVERLEAARLEATRAAAEAAISDMRWRQVGLEVVRDMGLPHERYAPFWHPNGGWRVLPLSQPAPVKSPEDSEG